MVHLVLEVNKRALAEVLITSRAHSQRNILCTWLIIRAVPLVHKQHLFTSTMMHGSNTSLQENYAPRLVSNVALV